MKTLAVLFVLTSHASLGDTGKPTGLWLEEFTTPYYALVDAGYTVEIASIQGGAVPIDPGSLPPAEPQEKQEKTEIPASVTRYLRDSALQEALRRTTPVAQVKGEKFAAIMLPGGHGTVWDLPNNAHLATLIGQAVDAGRIVAAVCHGPAGLVSAKRADGSPVVQGKRVSAFTNAEEEAVGLTSVVPFLLETRLQELGATIVKGPNFTPHAVRDGTLITGQNPASSEKVAVLVIEALKEQR